MDQIITKDELSEAERIEREWANDIKSKYSKEKKAPAELKKETAAEDKSIQEEK